MNHISNTIDIYNKHDLIFLHETIILLFISRPNNFVIGEGHYQELLALSNIT